MPQIKAEELLVAADFLEEHGFAEVADWMREFLTEPFFVRWTNIARVVDNPEPRTAK